MQFHFNKSVLIYISLGYIFVKANTWLAETGRVDPRDSRKIIHCLSAPLFILFWVSQLVSLDRRNFLE